MLLLVLAGSGAEALFDGPAARAAFNQPSGLAFIDEQLYIADPEASALRLLTLGPDGTVRTLVGQGLFDFGDVDGSGDEVRLQHPTGVALLADRLFIADSYNHKIKELDLATGTVTTVAGSGAAGRRDGDFDQATFFQPEGLAIDEERRWLYVADVNNHAIRRLDLANQKVVTLQICDSWSPAVAF